MAILSASFFASPAGAAERFDQNFAQPSLNRERLKFVGANAEEAIEHDSKGLLVRLPTTKPGRPQVGVETLFQVEGDFEITASFEALETEEPEKGYGSGVVLRVVRVPESPGQATLARFFHPRKGQVFVTATATPGVSKTTRRERSFPTETEAGRLRLIRKGPILRFLVAEENDQEFRELHRVQFGSAALRSVSFLGDTGGSTAQMSVRLTDLSIRGRAFSPIGSSRRNRIIVWFWVVIGFALVAMAAGWAVYWVRRGRASRGQPQTEGPRVSAR